MKKLSNINESTWGEMRQRSAGEVIRKEDDINTLNPTDFAEYLQNHYTTVNYGKPADYSNINGNDLVSINVFAFKPFIADLYYHYAGEKITLSRIYADSVKKSYSEFFIKLEECFSIEIEKIGNETDRIIFNPKDNSPISNTFFIEVLDKLIEIVDEWISKIPSNVTKLIKKKGHINESAWGEMRQRSAGEVIRKEDDVNTLDVVGLYEYIDNHYQNISSSLPLRSTSDRHSYISYPIFNSTYKLHHRLHRIDIIFVNDEINKITLEASRAACSEFFDILNDKYDIDDNGGFGVVTIHSKTGKFIIQDAIDIINIIIDNSNAPALKRKENS